MTIIKVSKPKKDRTPEKYQRRYHISSEGYATEYTNSLLMAYVHYYGSRLAAGGKCTIVDTQGEEIDEEVH